MGISQMRGQPLTVSLPLSCMQSKVTPAAQGQTLKDSIWYKTGLLEENSAEAWGPEILVVPREKTPTGAAARGNP